jgi:ribosomal protein L29
MQAVRRQAAFAAAPRVARRQLVVVAVKPTRANDFRGLSDEELYAKMSSMKTELASTRFLARTRGVAEFKPGQTQPQPDPEKMPRAHQFKHIRRQIAQMSTILRERELKAGIDSRESRRAQRQAALGLAGSSVRPNKAKH